MFSHDPLQQTPQPAAAAVASSPSPLQHSPPVPLLSDEPAASAQLDFSTANSSDQRRLKRVVVDTYSAVDTGGTEALVQLFVALSQVHPKVYLRRLPTASRLHPRLLADYPAAASADTIDVGELHHGDVLFQPELRGCNSRLRLHGVTQLIYMLAWPYGQGRKLRVPIAPCRVVAHSLWLAHVIPQTRTSLIIQPYLTPSVVEACSTIQHRISTGGGVVTKEDLVLLDHDSPASVTAALRDVRRGATV
eukprot:102193-Prymnesium_polylepis.2